MPPDVEKVATVLQWRVCEVTHPQRLTAKVIFKDLRRPSLLKPLPSFQKRATSVNTTWATFTCCSVTDRWEKTCNKQPVSLNPNLLQSDWTPSTVGGHGGDHCSLWLRLASSSGSRGAKWPYQLKEGCPHGNLQLGVTGVSRRIQRGWFTALPLYFLFLSNLNENFEFSPKFKLRFWPYLTIYTI